MGNGKASQGEGRMNRLFKTLGSRAKVIPCLQVENSFTQFRGYRSSTANAEPIKTKQLADEVLALDLVEINQFLKYLQRRLDVPDEIFYGTGFGGGMVMAAGAGAAQEEEVVKEREAWDVQLKSFDAKAKIKVIKEVRGLTGLGLKEAKELVEKAPCIIKPGVKKDEAEEMMKVLTELGAVVELV